MAEPTPEHIAHISLQCVCGAVLFVCWCVSAHPRRTIQACGVCTDTGALPVETEERDE